MPQSTAKATRSRTRSERLEARLSAAQKALIEQAAALQGRSVTDFVLVSAQDAARRTIEEHARIELSVRDSLAFAEALLNPKPASGRLRETVRRYRRATGVYGGDRPRVRGLPG
jgi:uncharacterized protein (DUF1778 family)